MKTKIFKTFFEIFPYSNIIKDYLHLFSAKSLQMGLAFVREIVLAKILGPTSFGTWKGIEIIQLYHQYSTLGTQNGMTREIPKLRGMGKERQINNLRNVALGHVFTLPLFVSILIMVYSFFITNDLIQFGVRMTAINVLLLMGTSFFVRLYYADMRFSIYSKIAIYLSFILNIFAIICAVTLEERAPYIIIFINNVIWLSTLIKYGKYNLRPKISFIESWGLIKIGFPIMIIGFLYGLLTTIDRLIILKYFDVTHLGYYSVFIMVGLVMTGISSSLGEIIYPRMNKRFGEKGTPESLDFLLFSPSYIMSSVLGIICSGIVFVIIIFGPIYFNEYKPGFSSAMIFCIGASFGGGSILNTIDKQWVSVGFQVIALAINVLLSLWLIHMNFGITSVAIGTTVALIFHKLGSTCASYYFIRISIRNQLKRLTAVAIPSFLTGSYYISTQYVISNYNNDISIQILVLLIFILVSSIILALRVKSIFNQTISFKYDIHK